MRAVERGEDRKPVFFRKAAVSLRFASDPVGTDAGNRLQQANAQRKRAGDQEDNRNSYKEYLDNKL